MEVITQADLAVGDTFQYPKNDSPESELVIEITNIDSSNNISVDVFKDKIKLGSSIKPNKFLFDELKNGLMIPINRRDSITRE